MTYEPSENPYATPQTEIRTSKPTVVYIQKFNGKLAFWSALAIGLVLFFLWLPACGAIRPWPRIGGHLMIIAISVGLGFLLGKTSGTPVPESSIDQETEELPPDEPTR